LVVHCFRNTVLEDYHSEWPEFTQKKMKKLMQQAVNKLNTALHVLFRGDEATCNAAWEYFHGQYPSGWDASKFDQGMLRVIELTKQARQRDMEKAKARRSSVRSGSQHP